MSVIVLFHVNTMYIHKIFCFNSHISSETNMVVVSKNHEVVVEALVKIKRSQTLPQLTTSKTYK